MTHLIDPVGDAVQRILLCDPGSKAGDIAVPAGDADGVTGRDDPGPFDVAAVDRMHQGNVGEVVGADIAHRGEARLDRALRILDAIERFVSRRQAHRKEVEPGSDLFGEVGMHVDEAGEERRVAEVDAGGAGRGGTADLDDGVAADYDEPVGNYPARTHIEHAGGVDRSERRGLAPGRGGGEHGKRRGEGDGSERHLELWPEGDGRNYGAANRFGERCGEGDFVGLGD